MGEGDIAPPPPAPPHERAPHPYGRTRLGLRGHPPPLRRGPLDPFGPGFGGIGGQKFCHVKQIWAFYTQSDVLSAAIQNSQVPSHFFPFLEKKYLHKIFFPFFSEGANCAADLMRRGQPDRLAALSKATRRGPISIYFLGRLEPFLTSLF